MRERVIARIGVGAALVVMLVFAMGQGALAADGPTPPQPGDPIGANVSPHGGYSSASNFCNQCHDIHGAANEYALLWKSSVTETCATCHGYMGVDPTGPRDPGGPGTLGSASGRAVYTVSSPNGQHQIGATSVPGDSTVITEAEWSYGWRSTFPPAGGNSDVPAGSGTAAFNSGGLYCASCHTPHGTYGRAINSRKINTSEAVTHATDVVVDWAEGQGIWWKNLSTASPTYRYLHLDTDPAGVWEVCAATGPAPVAGGPDTGCDYAQVKDQENQTVSLYGYKLLTAYPNHTYTTPQSWGTNYRERDQAKWCGACHPSRVDTSLGGTQHNHPTACTYCHGNPSDLSSYDFPHTSGNDFLLKGYLDATCISCHTNGSLP